MVVPTITYDAASGSDTAASGAGPATAVTGVDGDATAAGTTFTLNETVDFTGAADDGSDALWALTAAGDRNLFSIASFTGGVSTCTAIVTAETFDANLLSVDWAVGGKRKTLTQDLANQDWVDWITAGVPWTAEFEEGTYTVNAAMTVIGGSIAVGPLIMRKTSAATTLPILTVGTGAFDLFDSVNSSNKSVHIEDLELSTENSTGAKHVWNIDEAINLRLIGCTLKSSDDAIDMTSATTGYATVNVEDCDLTCAAGRAINNLSSTIHLLVANCRIHDTADSGISWNPVQKSSISVIDTEIIDSASHGVVLVLDQQYSKAVVHNCTIFDSTNHGIKIQGVINRPLVHIANNIFYSNGLYGIQSDDDSGNNLHVGPNAFGNNTSGSLNRIVAHPDDVTLTADPFVDSGAATPDLGLNEDSGGGALIDHNAEGRAS